MTEKEKKEIIQGVLKTIEPQLDGPDFKTGELAKLIGMNPVELCRIREKVCGFYLCGSRARFRRAEVLYRRAMGLNIFKD